MDKAERDQVRLLLEHLSSQTLRKVSDAEDALYAEHSANGCLRSGATVKRAVEIVEGQATSFVERAVDEVSAVAQDIDAFQIITGELTTLFRALEAHLEEALRKATGGEIHRNEGVKTAGEELFAGARERTFKQLEVYRFSFTKPSKGDRVAREIGVSAAIPQGQAVARNPGGKPLAAHWDAMWAAIAVKLWLGDLDPKSQADVKKAMFDWCNDAGIDVGDTALTQRARQLWQAMQEADS